jgi:O-antigen ligase
VSPRKRDGRRARLPRPRDDAGRPGLDVGATIAVAALGAVLVGTALLVDPRAEASFDAPKRLVALVGIAVAAAALLVPLRPPSDTGWAWRVLSRTQRIVVVLVGIALAIAIASALSSPRRGPSLDATRTLLLFALLLPLGASRALEGRRATILMGAFLGATAVNAIVSVLQFTRVVTLFEVEIRWGRRDDSAFVGNDGLLALTLGLACLCCVALVLSARRPAIRWSAGLGIPLFLAGLGINQSLTAIMALASGSIALMAMLCRRRTLVVATAIALGFAAGVTLHPAPPWRVQEVLHAARNGQWDALLSYRFGPWAAAIEMARARPLLGWGPGTFGAEFVPHRLRAELRFHRRFVNPFLAGSYSETHSDYLQAVAESGLPAGLAVAAAAAALALGLLRATSRAPDDGTRLEAIVLFAIVCAGAAATLTWFPFQRPVTAVPLLLAAGRAWRIAGRTGAGV